MHAGLNQEYRRQMILNMTQQELLLLLVDELKKNGMIASSAWNGSNTRSLNRLWTAARISSTT